MTTTRERRREVMQMFSGTGAVYDGLVAAATMGEDSFWKQAVLARLEAPRRVLDLACGTGILTFLIRDRFPECRVVGVDLTQDYLEVARAKARERGDDMVTFLHGSADEAVPDGFFDTVVSCYVPKYVDLPRLVSLICGLLTPGAQLVLHDFLYPRHPSVRVVWEKRLEELVAWARENQPEAVPMMEILPGIIRRSRWNEELLADLRSRGFTDLHEELLSWGTAAIVSGRAPA